MPGLRLSQFHHLTELARRARCRSDGSSSNPARALTPHALFAELRPTSTLLGLTACTSSPLGFDAQFMAVSDVYLAGARPVSGGDGNLQELCRAHDVGGIVLIGGGPGSPLLSSSTFAKLDVPITFWPRCSASDMKCGMDMLRIIVRATFRCNFWPCRSSR